MNWLLGSPLEVVMLVSIILNAMAGGIIFIFSNTIMPALATLDSDVGIKIMNTINKIIVNPLFIGIFFGGLISVIPTAIMLVRANDFSQPARYYALTSTLMFFFGEFIVTMTKNVPRNKALSAVDPKSNDGKMYWKDNYLKSWVAWNTVRCIFSVIAAVFGVLCLSHMRTSPSQIIVST